MTSINRHDKNRGSPSSYHDTNYYSIIFISINLKKNIQNNVPQDNYFTRGQQTLGIG